MTNTTASLPLTETNEVGFYAPTTSELETILASLSERDVEVLSALHFGPLPLSYLRAPVLSLVRRGLVREVRRAVFDLTFRGQVVEHHIG